ncbi:POTRA domain-containing protein, partial [Bordetella trematum]|uniref:POTRA domain-containing protein n=1 Tax=Bordetella trematum TaxID=123899 RepID=UPI003D12F996
MGPWLRRARRTCAGLLLPLAPALAQTPHSAPQEWLRQQTRERVLREQRETAPYVRSRRAPPPLPERLPRSEAPCVPIDRIRLTGEEADHFLWSLQAANPRHDPATGRCLGTAGINVVMARVQNAIIARGFVTTRILAAPQDLTTGTLTLTLVPGRLRSIRFAPGTSLKATSWNAVPARRGDLLNLRDIEQALEN